MSKGNPSLKVRLPPATIARVREIIAIKNEKRFEQPLTPTDFIQAAIATAIKEFERHQRWNKNKRGKTKEVEHARDRERVPPCNDQLESVKERQENNEPAGETSGETHQEACERGNG